MTARIIWGLVFLLVLGLVVLIWTTPTSGPEADMLENGAAMEVCANNPQSAACR